MLNLAFLRNPRFGAASMSISLASFSLFGAIFAMTQFLQDAHGWSALQAGAAMTPLAFGLVTGAVSGTKLVEQSGRRRSSSPACPCSPRCCPRAPSGAPTWPTGQLACGSSAWP